MITDPITAEVIRHGLTGAAEHMQVALCRMAFSPIIVESNDFAAGLFDRQARLLAQARSMPGFLGTLGMAIEAIVEAAGGEETLAPGDVLISTYAYHTGSHPPDIAFVVPGFVDGTLVGYACIKAHVLDLGAKDTACTDSTDNFQEGLILPGVRLYRAGERQDDVYRILMANSRAPESLAGDVTAIMAAIRMGLNELYELIGRYGFETFTAAVGVMFDHGEAVMRELLDGIPDGRYVAQAQLDNNGITDEAVPFSFAIEVAGSDIVADFTDAPPLQPGPINCPRAMTVSATRAALMSIVGGAESCNEGFFRPLRVETTPATLFHAVSPAPVFLYGWPAGMAYDALHQALAAGLPDRVPARSGGDGLATVFVGSTPGQFWMDGMNHVVGQGASAKGDQGGPTLHMMLSGQLTFCPEAIESRGKLRVERYELAQDTAGAGRHRGGLGVRGVYRTRQDSVLSLLWEQTRTPGWGLHGGAPATANWYRVTRPDGDIHEGAKLGSYPAPAGTVVEVRSGGGGGWGPPAERDVAAVHADVRAEYLSEEQARSAYPHAFENEDQR